jgi:hypothetical protein
VQATSSLMNCGADFGSALTLLFIGSIKTDAKLLKTKGRRFVTRSVGHAADYGKVGQASGGRRSVSS